MTSGRSVFLGTIALAIAVTLGLTVLIMRPPTSDVVELALIFAAGGLGASVLGFASHRMGWWRRVRSLTHSLTVGHLLAALVGIGIVLLAAQLMFINSHDLTLAGLLLLFASSVAVSFGYFLATSITERLRALDAAAERLSAGDFSARVRVEGQDEVADLALAFNSMAAKLERAEEEAAKLEKARREFIAGASHDLRTPLASLRAMLEAIADGVADDPQEYVARSQRVIDRMSRLTDDLVELARLDSGAAVLRMQRTEIAPIVERALESAAPQADLHGIALHNESPPDPPSMTLDESAIARVLQNLLDNAIRHSRNEVWVRLERANGNIEICVEDDGPGIDAERLPHVFERFYRGESSRATVPGESGGVGLGLAIAKELVEAHDGEIWAESGEGGGTRVTFRLPQS